MNDTNTVKEMDIFKGKVLLITGGSGSFGNAAIKRFLSTDIAEIRIFSRDEKKQHDMREHYNSSKLKFYLGDVRDIDSIRDAMFGVDYLFHAAALKQIPSCEFHPMQAIKTNVLGTENVLNVAIENKVRKVIVLSTDKAVYPINAMGMSKALMEKIAISKSKKLDDNVTKICCTRYGNVMASRGSVIPLFIYQLCNNKPITVTDPTMTRFMMSLDQAVELVLFAFQHGKNGNIFVQKAPAATIELLAKTIRKIFNKENHSIKVIGTRHGEKLYETLLTREEMAKAIDFGEYYCVPSDERDLNYDKYFVDGEKILTQAEEYHSHNTEKLDEFELKKLLLNLPEIKSDLVEFGII